MAGHDDRRQRRPKPDRLRWSSWTKRNFAVCRVRSPCTVPAWPWLLGDVAETVTYARRALDARLRGRPSRARQRPPALLGLASWASGDLEAAHRTYAAGMASVQRAGHISDVARRRDRPGGYPHCAGSSPRGDAHLRAGVAACGGRTGGPVLRGTADLYVGMSELHRERNDLHAATAAPADGARSWASTPGCRRTGIAGAWRWRGYGRLEGIWTARSTCSTRQSACMSATSSRMCGRSRR